MANKRRARKLNVYSNLVNGRKSRKDAAHRKKAEYLATLPKHPVKRLLARMHPKRVADYWFSKKGGMMLLKIAGVSVVLAILLVGGLFAYFRKDLASISPEKISDRVYSTVTKYYDRRGPAGGADALLWEDKGQSDYRVVVDGNQISPIMKKATVAIEDKDFYKHGGISFSGIMRALVNNYSGGSTQGGSTLTQQLVKQVFFADEAQQRGLNGVPRKIKEVILSIEVERMYDKDQILNLYLNESPYGGRRNGVESAARSYFGISAKDLNLAQSALLAAIPNQPGLYNPYLPEGQQPLIERQHRVLDAMVEQGFATKDEAQKAKEQPILASILPQTNQYDNMKAPHFVQMVKSQLEAELGKATVGKGGLTVTTTLDQGIQNQLEASIKEMFNCTGTSYSCKPGYAGFTNGAATVEDTKTGQIVALMGSKDYNAAGFGQDNAATAYIQPGSTIKPLVFAKLLSKNDNTDLNIYGSGTVIPDVKTTFQPGNYTPNNADKGFRGNITLRQGLALSRNIPAIKAMSITEVKPTLESIRAAGDTKYCTQGADAQVGLAAAIGGCGTRQIDHVNAFSTLARGGEYKPYATVIEVKNSSNATIKKWQDNQSKKVIDPEVAYILADILSDDNARAGLYGRNFPGLVVDKGRVKTASKTGTSDVDGKSKDIWMMSYSPALTMGVWLGNPDTRPLQNGNSSIPGPIVDKVMTYAHQEVYAKDGRWKQGDWYAMPKGVQKIGNELYPSWYNKNKAQQQTKLMFDKVSKKKATQCTPEAAKTEQSVIKTTDPTTKKTVFIAPSGFDASKDDDVHQCGDAKPSIGSINVSLVSGTQYKIIVNVIQGKGTLTGLTINVNGAPISDQPINAGGGYEAEYTAPGPGSFTISANAVDDLFYNGSSDRTYP